MDITQEAEEKVGFKGVIRSIIFEKEDYKIISFFTPDLLQNITIVGNFYGVVENEEISVYGKWKIHQKFGKQLEVEGWERDIPTTREGVISYLSSSLVKGCGKKKAKAIVDKLGENCIDLITSKGHTVLLEVSGLGEKQAKSIYESIVASYTVQKVMGELVPLGLTPNVINRAIKEFKGATINIIKENPYKLTKLNLIGFQKADEIAQKVGISPLSSYRIESCILYTLSEGTYGTGHCYIPAEQLVDMSLEALNRNLTAELKELSSKPKRRMTEEDLLATQQRISWIKENLVDDSLLVQGLISLAGQEVLVNEEGNIYPSYLYHVESRLAELISQKMKEPTDKVELYKVKEAILKYEQKENIKLAEAQKEGIIAITQNPILILTGGPGTGKTTVTKGMIEVFKRIYPKALIGLSAPTGRASRKLSESTGINESYTCHRVIGYVQGEEPQYNEDNPLDFDLMVIDEISMLDAPLALKVFQAIKRGGRLLLVGDPDQLESVGVGAVLEDMLKAGVPQVMLTEIFRQAQESQIIMNAHAINKGKKVTVDPKKNDFYFIEKEEPREIANTIKRSVLRFIELGYKVQDIMVLSPMKKGLIGTVELNKVLQEVLNPPSPSKPQIDRFETTFRVGDKVIITKNDKDKDVSNGDIGFITYVGERSNGDGEKEKIIKIDLGDRDATYKKEELGELDLAYCISIHKSQGGQAPIVIIPISTSHFRMLMRNLIYTGVTRAEKKLIFVGTKKALNIAIRNANKTIRNTLLAKRIKHFLNSQETEQELARS